LGNAAKRRQGNCTRQSGPGETPHGAQTREAKVMRVGRLQAAFRKPFDPRME